MHFLCYHVAETFLIMLIKNLIKLFGHIPSFY